MSKEYTAYGNYVINENFTAYINVPDKINTFSNMTIDQIVTVLPSLTIIDIASLLSTISDTSENIQRVSQILLLLPINQVYSIIPTMTIEPSNISISVIVSILLNMPIPTISLIIANMNIPQLIVFPVESNKSNMLYLLKATILSDPMMPPEKAALILSDKNIPICQAEIILSSMIKEKALLILSKMPSSQSALILPNIS